MMHNRKSIALEALEISLINAAENCRLCDAIIKNGVKEGLFTGEEPAIKETKALLARMALEGLDWINPNYLQENRA